MGRKFSCHGLSASALAAQGAGAAFPGGYSCFTPGSDLNPFVGSRCTHFIPGSVQGSSDRAWSYLGWWKMSLPIAEDGTGGSLRSAQPILENFQRWGPPSCCSHAPTPAQHSQQLWGLAVG